MARCAGELLVQTLRHSENMFTVKLYARQSVEVLSKDGCLTAASERGLYIYRGSRETDGVHHVATVAQHGQNKH